MRQTARTRARASCRAARDGFTLVEVLLALAILGFGMLALATMQIRALHFGRSGRHTSQAAVVARNEMEQLQRLPWDSVAPTGGWTPAVQRNTIVQSPSGDSVEQAYGVSWRIADLVATRTRSIDLRVIWSEPLRPSRSVTISTLRWNGGS